MFHFLVLPRDSYLLLLWLMSLLLSVTDLLYLTVEPKILYPFSLFAFLSYQQTFPFSVNKLLLPMSLILFFFCLTYFYPQTIGGGDIKLLIIYAYFISFEQLLYLLLLASATGIIFLLLINSIYTQPLRKLPFVPFLTFSLIIISLFF